MPLDLDDMKNIQVFLSRATLSGLQEITVWTKIWNALPEEIARLSAPPTSPPNETEKGFP